MHGQFFGTFDMKHHKQRYCVTEVHVTSSKYSINPTAMKIVFTFTIKITIYGPYIMYLEGAVNEISRSQSRFENRDA